MKWLILLLLLLILVAFVAYRYRRQIQTGWQMYLMFKKLRQATKPPAAQSEKQIKQKSADKSVPLIRCERCGGWVPQTEALNLRSKTFYCSAKCMERAVKLQSLVD
jgi:hypothetical protein